MIKAEVPPRVAPIEIAGPDDPEANYGTFERRDFPPLAENAVGYWWRIRLTEQGIASAIQARKGYNRIPCNPRSPNTLVITGDTTRRVNLGDAGRILLNEYLGMSLKEYILLLIEIFYLHNRKINSSTFPLMLPQTDNGAAIKARITQYLEDSDSLRGQLQTL